MENEKTGKREDAKAPEGINKGWWAVPTLQELRTID